MWSSVQGKSYTLVILVTLVFAVWNDGHHTRTKLVGETRTAEMTACQTGSPCPGVSSQVTTITTTDPYSYPPGGDGDGPGQGGDNGRGLKVGQLRP
jgi:hypothetical protein